MAKTSLLPASCVTKLNKAIEYELGHFYLYKLLANQMQQYGYFGAQAYFQQESAEELTHYQKHVDFLNNMGVLAKLPTLAPEKIDADSLEEALQAAFDNEYDLLKYYRKVWKEEAMEVPEVGAYLNEFLNIQVEHVGFYGDLLALLKDEKDNPNICMVVDDKLAKLAK